MKMLDFVYFLLFLAGFGYFWLDEGEAIGEAMGIFFSGAQLSEAVGIFLWEFFFYFWRTVKLWEFFFLAGGPDVRIFFSGGP